jgi:tetratricopeptide (TPR) repeat protein
MNKAYHKKNKTKKWMALAASAMLAGMLLSTSTQIASPLVKANAAEKSKQSKFNVNVDDTSLQKAIKAAKDSGVTVTQNATQSKEVSKADQEATVKAIQADYAKQQKALEDATAQQKKNNDTYNTAKAKYDKDKAAYDKAKAQYDKDEAAYEKAEAQFKKDSAQYAKDEAAYKTALDKYNKDEAAYKTAKAQYDKDKAAYDKAEAEYQKALTQYNKDYANYQQQKADYEKKLKQYNSDYAAWKEEVKEYNNNGQSTNGVDPNKIQQQLTLGHETKAVMKVSNISSKVNAKLLPKDKFNTVLSDGDLKAGFQSTGMELMTAKTNAAVS